MDFTVGIVSRNLATTSNSETIGICTFFEAANVMRDTLHIFSDSQCAMCQVQNEST